MPWNPQGEGYGTRSPNVTLGRGPKIGKKVSHAILVAPHRAFAKRDQRWQDKYS